MSRKRSSIAVLCDFDGTVATEDVGNLLFRRFSEDGRSMEVVEAWRRGEISSRECLERECALARASKEDIDRFLKERRLDPYFRDFLDFARRRKFPVVILSDGLDYYIEWLLMRHGVGDVEVYANHLVLGDHTLSVEFPYYDLLDCTDCGNCKKYHLEKIRERGHAIVYVGDGYSDRCPAEAADLVIAKGVLLEHCRRKGIPCLTYQSFRDVERHLLELFFLDGGAKEEGNGEED
jgi:2,3-diketo-5-methylthio-1-phosphopentane phosphatase